MPKGRLKAADFGNIGGTRRGFLEIGRLGTCVADETLFQTAPFFAVKVLQRFGITAVDKAVNIVAYQADIDSSDALAAIRLRLCLSRMAWAKRC